MTDPRFVLHYAPRSRAARSLWLLEEAGVPYELVVHDLARGTHKDPDYLAVNPDGKVPALVDRGPADGSSGWPVIIAESAAVCAHVAEVVPAAKLAPPIGSPERAAYLTWLVYASAAIEPALADLVFTRAKEPPASAIGWPPFAAVIERIGNALEPRTAEAPWLLGVDFSAADMRVGGMLQWLRAWGKLSPNAPIDRYLAALATRPALLRAQGKEAATLASQGQA